MPKGKSVTGFKPGKYTVKNSGKRGRVRGGHYFPGRGKEEASATTVEISDPRAYLQVTSARGLTATKGGGGGSKPKDQGDGLDQLTVEQLDERLVEAELSTDGNKPDKVARLREHEASQ